jgi:hypothetical protein
MIRRQRNGEGEAAGRDDRAAKTRHDTIGEGHARETSGNRQPAAARPSLHRDGTPRGFLNPTLTHPLSEES